jgi:hypothetical protein
MGVVLQDQGKLAEAAEAFHRALTLKPAYANAHYHLGLVRLWQGQEDAALSCFQRSADLTYNHGRGIAPAFVTKARVKHDYEQLHYLAAQAPTCPLPDNYQKGLTTLYHRIAQSSSDSIFLKLTLEEQMQMAPSFNRFVFIRPTERLEGSAINSSLNIKAIEAQYFSTSPEAMFVDELLTEQAMSHIRSFCHWNVSGQWLCLPLAPTNCRRASDPFPQNFPTPSTPAGLGLQTRQCPTRLEYACGCGSGKCEFLDHAERSQPQSGIRRAGSLE